MREFHGQQIEGLRGTPFAKMTGSGNDFVFFDGRVVDKHAVTSVEAVRAICNRHNGIGADGVVLLEPISVVDAQGVECASQARILYFNSDGSAADLCGNATLCSTTMAVELGLAQPSEMGLETPAGRITSRVVGRLPEIELPIVKTVVTDLDIGTGPGERRAGFVLVGVPHLVVHCEDADSINLAARGSLLRHHHAVGSDGANVNWVSRLAGGTWRYRTFERGVEAETLACGTGAVATAILLLAWSLAESPVEILTSSGRQLVVGLSKNGDEWSPTLRGEGRVVFRGRIGDLDAEVASFNS